ncbi:unnamed protein product [Darwinula stevensoni]|uniref:Uncharacterized protein n=1 Tax=Darwinula stevensoni TaxID=69355 RepID=A0A7R9ABD3_9CRUS|nr:unnamed protein product [Darwinula stevensoni]CAG0899274.1 unnamed protein product [Darwinula stevensoni]
MLAFCSVNVCPVEEAGFSPSPIRYPVPWTGGDLCGTKTYLRNDCCPGYAKMAGLPGCALVKPLSSLGETAESKNGTAFARELGKIQGLVSKNALTVFVPIDQPCKLQSLRMSIKVIKKTEAPLKNSEAVKPPPGIGSSKPDKATAGRDFLPSERTGLR